MAYRQKSTHILLFCSLLQDVIDQLLAGNWMIMCVICTARLHKSSQGVMSDGTYGRFPNAVSWMALVVGIGRFSSEDLWSLKLGAKLKKRTSFKQTLKLKPNHDHNGEGPARRNMQTRRYKWLKPCLDCSSKSSKNVPCCRLFREPLASLNL